MIVNLNNESINNSVICLFNDDDNVDQAHCVPKRRKIYSKSSNNILDAKKSVVLVDTLSSSSLSSDNSLKQCKIELDEILQRQSKCRMKYDRHGNTLLSSSLEDETNTKKPILSYGSQVFHEDISKKSRPLKIKWASSTEDSSSGYSTTESVKFNDKLSVKFIQKQILLQMKSFPEENKLALNLCIDDVAQKNFNTLEQRTTHLIDTKNKVSKSFTDFFKSQDEILNSSIEMIPSFKLLLKYLANNLVWDVHYCNNTLMCSCPCSELNDEWKSTFMSKDEFCSTSKSIIKKSFRRCKSRQMTSTELKSHLKINSKIDFVHNLIYEFYKNVHCTFLPLKSFSISISNDNESVFSSQNILNNVSTKYYKYLKLSRYINLYYDLVRMVPSMTTRTRKLKMHVFGSTIGPSRSPKYCHKNNICRKKMLPRPMAYCKPGSKAWNYMNQPWFISLVKDIEMFTKEHVDKYAPSCLHMSKIKKTITFIENNIPSCLRICDTIFTQMVLVGEDNISSDMPLHLDKNDLLSCILTLGELKSGGATQYYSGKKIKSNNELLHQIDFHHGQIQIGRYDEIIHGVQSWIGTRLTINFNIKIPLIQHFKEEGSIFYDQYVASGYTDSLIVL